ncbi:MAG: chitobiase/beta-hexosaminidase C-terminal domain-containing protein [Bacteroidales bacterium]|nr:chitobiase/beta-hexosaminidase C-terminal domain-containing protein [Bacteroidales bacterium]
MMKLARIMLFVAMLLGSVAAKAQYNPEDPPEPGASYKLYLQAYPDDSGWFGMATESTHAPDDVFNVSVYYSDATKFQFVHWEDDQGTVLSTSTSFSYSMPARDVVLTARFVYDPANPSEPDEPDEVRVSNVYLLSNPTAGGWFSNTPANPLTVGETYSVYAYNHANFTFRNWTRDGEIIGTEPGLDYVVTPADSYLTANFDYTPDSPSEPEDPGEISYSRLYVTMSDSEAGSINIYDEFTGSYTSSGDRHRVGKTVRLSYSNNAGFVFKGWTLDGQLLSTSNYYTYTVTEADVHIIASLTYTPDSPSEPEEPENFAGVYGLTEYVALKQRFKYPIYLDNSLHQAKGMVIDVQFPEGFAVEPDAIEKTVLTTDQELTTQDMGDNHYRITTLGTENTLENACGIVMRIPVTIPDDAVVDSTYFVMVKYGVLTNMDDSQTPLKTHNGGLQIMEEGYCRITTSSSPYGYITGGGKYKLGDTVTLQAIPYYGYEFSHWTDDTTANPYVFVAEESLVIGAVYDALEIIQCETPTITFNGRYATLANTDRSTIHYTINGSEPTEYSPTYTEPFDTYGVVTIRAISMREDLEDSEEASYYTPAYFDGVNAEIGIADSLATAFRWTDSDLVKRLSVSGPVGEQDIKFIVAMPMLDHLDLRNADYPVIPTQALAGSNIVSVVMPETITSFSTPLFTGCSRLAAVVWPAPMQFSDDALGDISNPNLLLYVSAERYLPVRDDYTNVVVDGYADAVVLTDTEDSNFYCPEAFTAGTISYTHEYTMTTALNGLTAGWEAITMPFHVAIIRHESQGLLAPFAAGMSYDEAKPFWLHEFGATGFVPAASIEANKPYVISMPNNEAYMSSYILAGNVTFSATDALVPVTESIDGEMGDYRFCGTTVRVAASDTVAVLNREAIDEYVPGEAFVPSLRDAEPFEAYLTMGSEPMRGPQRVSALTGGAAGIIDAMLLKASPVAISAIDRTIRIVADRNAHVDVYNVMGVLVRSIDVLPGTTLITDLPAGIYIASGKKTTPTLT